MFVHEVSRSWGCRKADGIRSVEDNSTADRVAHKEAQSRRTGILWTLRTAALVCRAEDVGYRHSTLYHIHSLLPVSSALLRGSFCLFCESRISSVAGPTTLQKYSYNMVLSGNPTNWSHSPIECFHINMKCCCKVLTCLEMCRRNT